MSVSSERVDTVMNSAIAYLEECGIAPDPWSHYALLESWLNGLLMSSDPVNPEEIETLNLALDRLLLNLDEYYANI